MKRRYKRAWTVAYNPKDKEHPYGVVRDDYRNGDGSRIEYGWFRTITEALDLRDELNAAEGLS